MPFRRGLRAAVLGIAAVALVWVPSVSADSDAHTRVISGVSLVNNVSRTPVLGLSPLTDGTVVDPARLSNHDIGLRATVATGLRPSRVAFTVTGTKRTYAHTDARAPFFLCGDYGDCALLTTPDEYTLTVQAYSGTDLLGSALSVRFTVGGSPAAPALDVLFVGNSLLGTVTHATGEDTPDLIGHLASATGRALSVTKVIHFGYTLRHTWDDGLVAAALNGSRTYDFIVLQEYSTLVATKPATATSTLLNVYAPRFARALKPNGRVVLFKNWALVHPAPFRSRAAAKAAIDRNYAALSAALAYPNLLAPIGDEFETVIAAKGASYLIVADGKHPNDSAVYLDAVTLYGILFHRSPSGLPDLYLAASTASYLRRVAATAIGY